MYTWNELKKECLECSKCDLSGSRKNVVIGRGNEKASLLFVGEGPGQEEDEQGLPFVGKAGQLLDHLLNAIPFKPEEYYITNIIKCRPPENRDPSDHEAESCLPHLRNQFRLMRPKIIVCLGRVSAKYLIQSDFKITKDSGKWFEKGGIKMMAVYHPAYLLRNENEKVKQWRDFMEIRKGLNELYQQSGVRV